MTQYSFLLEFSPTAALNTGLGKATGVLSKGVGVASRSPVLVGTGAGALGGAVTGLKKDENGERHILRNAAVGAAGGAALGYGAKRFLRGKGYASRIQKSLTNKSNQFTGTGQAINLAKDNAVATGVKIGDRSAVAQGLTTAPIKSADVNRNADVIAQWRKAYGK